MLLFFQKQLNKAEINICETVKNTEGGELFKLTKFTVKKKFECDNGDIVSDDCYFDAPAGEATDNAACNTLWEMQDQNKIKLYADNPKKNMKYLEVHTCLSNFVINLYYHEVYTFFFTVKAT